MRTVTGTGHSPLDLLVQQLWRPLLRDGTVEIALSSAGPQREDEHTRDTWLPAETYWVLPTASAAEMLLPAESARVTAGAAGAYRGLRRPRAAAARSVLTVGARLGLPAGAARLTVRTLWNRPEDADPLPAALHSRRLGRPVHAAIGVNTSDNRKATLQLFDDRGRPAGYAKHAWNENSAQMVQTETQVLSAIGGRPGPMRAPGLLDHDDWLGNPYLTVQPMPSTVRAVRGARAVLTPAEIYAHTPVVRRGRLWSSTQFAGLRDRVAMLGDAAGQPELLGLLRALVQSLAQSATELPIGSRWHGDLTPWNCAREPDGQLWCWDWETSEADAPAGLDALHWWLSVAREAGPVDQIDLDEVVAASGPLLQAGGVGAGEHRLLGAVLVAALIERAATLAMASRSWEHSWITPLTAAAWCRQARSWL